MVYAASSLTGAPPRKSRRRLGSKRRLERSLWRVRGPIFPCRSKTLLSNCRRPKPLRLADAALFLDLDGTLAPIAARPQDVRPGPAPHPPAGAAGARAGRAAGRGQRPHAGRHRPHPGGLRRAASPRCTAWCCATATARLARAAAAPGRWRAPSRSCSAFAAQGHRPDRRGEGPLASPCTSAWPAATPPRRGRCARDLAAETGLALQEGDMVEELRTPGPSKGDSVRAFMRLAPFAGVDPDLRRRRRHRRGRLRGRPTRWAASACWWARTAPIHARYRPARRRGGARPGWRRR